MEEGKGREGGEAYHGCLGERGWRMEASQLLRLLLLCPEKRRRGGGGGCPRPARLALLEEPSQELTTTLLTPSSFTSEQKMLPPSRGRRPTSTIGQGWAKQAEVRCPSYPYSHPRLLYLPLHLSPSNPDLISSRDRPGGAQLCRLPLPPFHHHLSDCRHPPPVNHTPLPVLHESRPLLPLHPPSPPPFSPADLSLPFPLLSVDVLQLANAYSALAAELTSTEIKNLGGYSLGRVIGEG